MCKCSSLPRSPSLFLLLLLLLHLLSWPHTRCTCRGWLGLGRPRGKQTRGITPSRKRLPAGYLHRTTLMARISRYRRILVDMLYWSLFLYVSLSLSLLSLIKRKGLRCKERPGARLFFVYVQDSDRERRFLTLSVDLGISVRLSLCRLYLCCLQNGNMKTNVFG